MSMKRISDIDSTISMIFNGLLLLDVLTDYPAPIDYINYVFMGYFVFRIIVLYINFKKGKEVGTDWSVVGQYGKLLGIIASFLFFVVALMDMFYI